MDLNPESQEHVVIELDDPPDLSGTVVLSGELGIPASWGELDLEVVVKPLDVPTIQGKSEVTIPFADMDATAQGRLEWVAGAVVPGRYRIAVQPLNLCKTVEVEESGIDPVIMDVPPPADVTVQVVEEESQLNVPLLSVSWWVPGSQLSGCQLIWERRDSDDERFSFRAPLGSIEVANLFSNDWRVDRTNFVLHPGNNNLVVQASSACGIRLTLFDGEVTIPQGDLPQNITVRGSDPSLRMVSWGMEGSTRVLRLSGPGSYNVTVPRISGFELVPQYQVNVGLGEFAVLDIDLVRGK